MKTIQEKAEAYDKAIENAKIVLLDCTQEVRTVIEYIHPELKESEDELAWLKKYIEEEAYYLSMDISGNEDHIKLKNLQRSLAWLEKQGKQKSNPCEKCEHPKEGMVDIENACEWLLDNVYGYIDESDKFSGGYTFDFNSFLNDFRNAMEDGRCRA